MQEIYIAGYPRSGNVWLSRLVSDIFNCSITGSQGRTSIAETQRPNKNYHVYQDHFYPVLLDNGDAEFVKKRNLIISNKPDNAYIVFVYRNPLDVAVSVYKYWRMDSLRTALKEMKDGGRVPCYPKFMTAWLDSSSKRFVNTFISYEQMSQNLGSKLRSIVSDINFKGEIDYDKIIKRNHIANMRKQVNTKPETFSYNSAIQNRHMRKGIVGDWVNHFTEGDFNFAFDFMKQFIITFGYFDTRAETEDVVRQQYLDALRYATFLLKE